MIAKNTVCHRLAPPNPMSSEQRVTRGSQGSILSTPTPAAGTRAKTTNPPKIGGGIGGNRGQKKANRSPPGPKRATTKIVPVLQGIKDYMSVLPQDLVKELKQSTRKAQWEAVAVEFMRKCAWRLRHFDKDELQNIAANVIPSPASIVSIEHATEFLSETQKDIQSGIAMAHESVARWFMYTSAGKEYLAYAKKTK